MYGNAALRVIAQALGCEGVPPSLNVATMRVSHSEACGCHCYLYDDGVLDECYRSDASGVRSGARHPKL